jgi:uncharacterized membrane protein YcaP (DUF421 family)
MKPEEIHLTDYMRIILGQVPWSFLVEAIIRAVFLYALIILAMRLMGKRMSAGLSRDELAAIASIAAAIGVPIQAPDRGLLPAVIIAAVIVIVQRTVFRISFSHKKFEDLSQGDIGIMVKDGCLQYDAMTTSVLPKERIFSELRNKGYDNLGEIKRLYMEASGAFTILKQEQPQPGLTLLPEWDKEFRDEQQKVPGSFACQHCGNVSQQSQRPCPQCEHQDWCDAVISSEKVVAV